MPLTDTDIAVLGAGPAGAVAALVLAREGWRVTLIDPGRPVRARLESLPINGQTLAADLNLQPVLKAAFRGKIEATQMLWRDRPERISHADKPPWLLDRAALHSGLRETAVQAGALSVTGMIKGCRTVGERVQLDMGVQSLNAGIVLDARGRAAHRQEALSFSLVGLPFMGQEVGGAGRTEMRLEALTDGWLWCALTRSGMAEGAVFTSPTCLAGRSDADRHDLLRQWLAQSVLCSHLAELTVRAPVPAALQAAPEPVSGDRVIKIGDAALARDPIASHGLVHAFRSAAQGAAAAATLLESGQSASAVHPFLRESHADAVRAATQSSVRAYGDQTRFDTGFWQAAAPVPPPAARQASDVPPVAGLLRFNSKLVQAPVFSGRRIVWGDALRMPASGDNLHRIGPFTASDLAHLLAEDAPLPTMAARLGRHAGPKAVQWVLEFLLKEGALTAPSASPHQAVTEQASTA